MEEISGNVAKLVWDLILISFTIKEEMVLPALLFNILVYRSVVFSSEAGNSIDVIDYSAGHVIQIVGFYNTSGHSRNIKLDILERLLVIAQKSKE